MKRFFTIAAAVALTAYIGANAWSQGSQSGGGGTSGGAGASGAAGASGSAGTSASGAAGTSGTAGTSGAAGTSGTAGAGTAGAAGNAGASGNVGARTGAGAAGQLQTGAGQAGVNARGQAGANAQTGANFNGISQTPFFAHPSVRQQLRLSDEQFNRLNTAYQNSLQRLSQGLTGQQGVNTRQGVAARQQGTAQQRAAGQQGIAGQQGAAGQQNATGQQDVTDQRVTGQGTSTAAAQRAQNLQEFQARQNTNVNGTTGTDNAAAQRAARLAEFQNRFNTDFNQEVESTLADPATRQRFNQLNLQVQGLRAFADPRIQRQLNLTADQRRQLMQLNTDFRQELNQLRRADRNNPQLTEQQLVDLRSRFLDQANTLLTPEQMQLWSQLVGERVDLPVEVFFPPEDRVWIPPVPQQNAAGGQNVPQTATPQQTPQNRVR